MNDWILIFEGAWVYSVLNGIVLLTSLSDWLTHLTNHISRKRNNNNKTWTFFDFFALFDMMKEIAMSDESSTKYNEINILEKLLVQNLFDSSVNINEQDSNDFFFDSLTFDIHRTAVEDNNKKKTLKNFRFSCVDREMRNEILLLIAPSWNQIHEPKPTTTMMVDNDDRRRNLYFYFAYTIY